MSPTARTNTDPARNAAAAALVGIGHAAALAAVTAGFYVLLAGGARIQSTSSTLLLATGLTGLLWSYVGLLLGLGISTRPPGVVRDGRASPRINRRLRALGLTWHRQLNLAVVAITVLHALVFALLSPGGSLLVAFVPGTAAVQSLGYTVGVLALYLALVLGPSYYFRERIGRRVWLISHQFAGLSYALGLWHSFALGPDFRLEGIGRVLFWVAQLPLLAALALRLRRPLRPADQISRDRRAGRYEQPRQRHFRRAVMLGILGTGVVVLIIVLLAMGPGSRVG